MCAQYVMYAKHVDDDGVVIHDASGLLGFGFDKAILPPPPRCSSPRTPHAAPLHSRRRNAPSLPHTRKHTPPPPSTRQALDFAATSTMKYKVYLTCDGKALTTGIMDLAVFSSLNKGRFSVRTDEVQVGYPPPSSSPCLLSPPPTPPHHTYPAAK